MQSPNRPDVRSARSHSGRTAVAMAAAFMLGVSAPGVVQSQPVSAAARAHAPAPSTALTLTEYFALLRGHPDVRAAQTRVDAAQGGVLEAGALPNPTVGYTRQRGERESSIEQPLPVFGQRGLRMDGARLGVASARADARQALADVLREGAKAFNGLLVAQARHARHEAAHAELKSAAGIVAGQVQAGARSRYDLARIEVQLAQAALDGRKAGAALEEAAAQVAALAARPGWSPRAVGSLRPSAQGIDEARLWERAQEQLPALGAALAHEEQAGQRVQIERREAWPTPVLSLSRKRLDEGRQNTMGVSMEIPLFDRRAGAVARAQAEREEARVRREASVTAAHAELLRAAQQVRLRREALERFGQEALGRLDELHRMAGDAYRLGQGGVLELIDAVESVTEKRLAYLDLTEEMLQAELDLDVASGQLMSLAGAAP